MYLYKFPLHNVQILHFSKRIIHNWEEKKIAPKSTCPTGSFTCPSQAVRQCDISSPVVNAIEYHATICHRKKKKWQNAFRSTALHGRYAPQWRETIMRFPQGGTSLHAGAWVHIECAGVSDGKLLHSPYLVAWGLSGMWDQSPSKCLCHHSSFWRRFVTYAIFWLTKFSRKHFVSLSNHTYGTHKCAGFWW